MILERISHYEFGNCRLDISNHELLKDGEPVILARKTFDILCFLVENHGKILKKEDLLSRFWDEEYLEETILAQQIYRIRKAIKNDETGENYIETVPKFGYRFSGEVRAQPNFELIEGGAQTDFDADETPASHDEYRELHVSKNGFHTKGDNHTERENAPNIQPDREYSSFRWIVTGCFAALAIVAILSLLYFRTTSKSGLSSVRSIAVLPFNQIGEEKDEKLGLGVADALISRLSVQTNLSVIPTGTVARFSEDQANNVVAIGRDLEVDAVLTGTIQREKGVARVNVQLVSTAEQIPIWADKFDANFTDIFTLQDEIGNTIINRLPIERSDRPESDLKNNSPRNPEAFKAFWLGVSYWSMHTSESFRKAIQQFDRAIESDPDFPLSHAYLADTYAHTDQMSEYLPEEELLKKAERSATFALKLDPNCAEALAALALVYSKSNRAKDGFDLIKKAVKLKPGYSHGHLRLSWMYANNGEINKAVEEAQISRALDPQSAVANASLAEMLYYFGKFENAVQVADTAINLDPEYIPGQWFKLLSIEQLARREDFDQLKDKVFPIIFGKGSPTIPLIESRLLLREGKRDEAIGLLREVEKMGVSPYLQLCSTYAVFGQKENAIKCIQEIFIGWKDDIYRLKFDPNLASVRGNSKYLSLMKKKEAELGW